MTKMAKSVLVIALLMLIALQYQNCSNSSDGAFWQEPSGGVVVTLAGTARFTNQVLTTDFLTPDRQYFELEGLCNPGINEMGVMSYQLFTNTGSPIAVSPTLSSSNCDSGRFNFVVAKPSCPSGSMCQYVVRAKMQTSRESIDLAEYFFQVPSF